MLWPLSGFRPFGLLRYSGQDEYAQNKDMIRKESISARQFLQRQMIHEKGLESPDNATRHESPKSLSLPHLRSVERGSLIPGLPVQSEFETPERNESCYQGQARVKQRFKPK